MTALPKTTIRRLQQLPLTANVWEGDRRCLQLFNAANLAMQPEASKDCILWVDGSSGTVRATDIISADVGIEAAVRTLVRAIEKPDGPSSPALPQKIIVRDRQLQFFLRGALQNLDITIDYAPRLPLIDQLFQDWETPQTEEPPALPPQYEPLLEEIAAQLWYDSPWQILCDHHVISIKIDLDESHQLYGCVMGKLNREYGVVLYRSLDSMMQFRTAAAAAHSPEEIEAAFLSQDCWFVNFEADDSQQDIGQLAWAEIHPIFGSIHPYEGIRLSLDSEEAAIVLTALRGLGKFYLKYGDRLTKSEQAIEDSYRISYLLTSNCRRTATVEVATTPEISQNLWLEEHKYDWDQDEPPVGTIAIRDDLIPEGTFISLSSLPQQLISQLQNQPKIYTHLLEQTTELDSVPVVIVQTSRPKAKTIINQIKAAGGLKLICFHQGNNEILDASYDLGLLQTNNGNIYLLTEYLRQHKPNRALVRWCNHCDKNQNRCSFIIAMGITGASRGNPQPKDIMAVLDIEALPWESQGILQLMSPFEF